MNIKPKTAKWEVSNFLPGTNFDAVRSGGFLSEDINRRRWSQAEQVLHINILELRAAKFTFCRYKNDVAVHV